MKPERVENQRNRLASGNLVDDATGTLIDSVTGTVLDINGGVGLISEYLSNRGCQVTLVDPERLSFSFRKRLVPDSKVRTMNVDGHDIKLNKPLYDFVIIRNLTHVELAKKICKKGIVNLITMEIEYVISDTQEHEQVSETNGPTELDEVSETSILPS